MNCSFTETILMYDYTHYHYNREEGLKALQRLFSWFRDKENNNTLKSVSLTGVHVNKESVTMADDNMSFSYDLGPYSFKMVLRLNLTNEYYPAIISTYDIVSQQHRIFPDNKIAILHIPTLDIFYDTHDEWKMDDTSRGGDWRVIVQKYLNNLTEYIHQVEHKEGQ